MPEIEFDPKCLYRISEKELRRRESIRKHWAEEAGRGAVTPYMQDFRNQQVALWIEEELALPLAEADPVYSNATA